MTASPALFPVYDTEFDVNESSIAHADWKTYFYVTMLVVGAAGLTILLVTMLWPTKHRRPRNPLLLSLCFSWWISTFPCLCLLYYAGQVTGPPPKYGVCLASGALTMAQSVLVSSTALALVSHIWLIVKTAVSATFSDERWLYWSTFISLILPYLLFIATAIAALVLGLLHPSIVHRATFYCIVDTERLTIAISVIGVICTAAAIALEIWTIILLHQNRTRIKQLSHEGRGFDISLVIRVCIFGVYLLLGLCLNAVALNGWTNPIPDIFFSTFTVAVFIVFGTQRDIWRIWCTVSRNLASSSIPMSSPNTLNRLFQIRSQTSHRLSYSLNIFSRTSHSHSQGSHQLRSGQSTTHCHDNSHRSRHAITLPLPATLRDTFSGKIGRRGGSVGGTAGLGFVPGPSLTSDSGTKKSKHSGFGLFSPKEGTRSRSNSDESSDLDFELDSVDLGVSGMGMEVLSHDGGESGDGEKGEETTPSSGSYTTLSPSSSSRRRRLRQSRRRNRQQREANAEHEEHHCVEAEEERYPQHSPIQTRSGLRLEPDMTVIASGESSMVSPLGVASSQSPVWDRDRGGGETQSFFIFYSVVEGDL